MPIRVASIPKSMIYEPSPSPGCNESKHQTASSQVMFLNSSRLSISVSAIWVALTLFNACALAATYPYTVYRGTFVQLPRLNSSSTKPELARTQGALWVGTDGRIKGYDWSVHDDASFKSFLSSHGWADADASNANAKATKVKIVKSNDERNEFFFPGFIGMSHFSPK